MAALLFFWLQKRKIGFNYQFVWKALFISFVLQLSSNCKMYVFDDSESL